MKPAISRFRCIALLSMLAVGSVPTSQDSTGTALHLSAGGGQFAAVSRGCSGDVLWKEDVPFTELNAGIDHKTRSPVRLGIRGSYLRLTKANLDAVTLNPFADLEWKYVGLGGGYVWASEPLPWGDQDLGEGALGGRLRLGNRRSLYADVSFLHSEGVCTDGYLRLGVGSDYDPRFRWWVGTTSGPYDRLGLGLTAKVRVQSRLYANATARLGSSAGISENAFSLGLTYLLPSSE
jgi:hypothetical protein